MALTQSLLCGFLLVFFTGSYGQVDHIRRIFNPHTRSVSTRSDDLPKTFSEISSQTDQIERELNRLKQAFDDLEGKLDSYLGVSHETRPTESPVTVTHVRDTPTTQGPAITSCTKGMSHDQPRVELTLPGGVRTMCDTETDGGGWIIIQRRTKGDVDFYKGWDDYKKGFGTPDTDFWLGNEVIHSLTDQGYTELRIDLEYQGNKLYAHYSSFSIGDEGSGYQLTVSGHSGTAGDSLSYHTGAGFTTFDRDNDEEPFYNCGEYSHGAWWYKDCFESNLNGLWGKDGDTAMIWKSVAQDKVLASSEIKIRHV